MVDIKTILSDVQMDLGDSANTAIQRAEYVDTVNNILRQVASKTKVWLARKVYTPNDGTGTDPIYQCALSPDDSPISIIAVYRKTLAESSYLECREYGYNSNIATLRGESSFQKNDIQLGRRNFHTQYMNEETNLIDDGVYIIFNQPIEASEQIAVDFISGDPVNVVLWSESMTLQIPDFLEDAVRYGLQWKLMERLYNRGNDSYGPRANKAEANYDKYLREARTEALNFKHSGSSLQVTPHIWLPEQPR